MQANNLKALCATGRKFKVDLVEQECNLKTLTRRKIRQTNIEN